MTGHADAVVIGMGPGGEDVLSWSAQRNIEGEFIELDEARRRGVAHWSPLLSANRGIDSR